MKPDYLDLLKQSGLKKRELAERLGRGVVSVARWQDKPPKYVTAYLEVLVENQKLKSHEN